MTNTKSTKRSLKENSTTKTPSKDWTEGRFRAFITSTLRGGFRRYPPKYTVLKAAYSGKKLNKASKRQCMHYVCNSCKKEFPSKEVNVDHILPVVDPITGFVDWNTFIDRLFCKEENLQVLCSKCHTEKTKQERQVRNDQR
jgi:hypothetical protein